jgi:tungstate transport system permease protein
MEDIARAFLTAFRLILRFDPELAGIVLLSLRVSLSATFIASLIGVPLGIVLAIAVFPGRHSAIVFCHALLGLPPVTVGLFVYLLLSRSGPLGGLGLLFTPGAMILAQTCLAIPIIAALVQRVAARSWVEYRDEFTIAGASGFRIGRELLRMDYGALLTAFLTAFGRLLSEVGAILVVGGNIRFYTRTMTTAIALETNKGDLSFALALGLVLILISLAVSTLAFSLNHLFIEQN